MPARQVANNVMDGRPLWITTRRRPGARAHHCPPLPRVDWCVRQTGMTDTSKPHGATFPPASPVHLAELVSYAAGSVVSRTIKKGEAGTLTVFAFDEGEGLSEHSAPFDAFVQILEGQAELTIDGQAVEASAGEMVLLPAKIPHALRGLTAFKMLLIMQSTTVEVRSI